MGQPGYDFDPQKFIYIGAANKENAVFVFGKKSGITSAENGGPRQLPVKIGGLVPGNFVDNMDRLMKDVLGFPTQIITGYKGTADILIATESGELAGGPPSWDNAKTNRKRSLEVGDMIVVIQCTAKTAQGTSERSEDYRLRKNRRAEKARPSCGYLRERLFETVCRPAGHAEGPRRYTA